MKLYETKSNSNEKFVDSSYKTTADSLLFESSFQVDSESPKYGYKSASLVTPCMMIYINMRAMICYSRRFKIRNI